MELGDGVVALAAIGLAVAAIAVAFVQQRKLVALGEETRRRGARALAFEQAFHADPGIKLALNVVTGERKQWV